MSFASPLIALAVFVGVALILGIGWYPLRRGRRRAAALRFSSIARLRPLSRSWRVKGHGVASGLRLGVLLLLLVAIARPQTGRKHTQVQSEGIDIVLAIDTSPSMLAMDLDADRSIKLRRNRLEVVKDVVDGFIKARPTDQLGLVVFGSEAFTQCPLTLDHGIVQDFVGRLEIGMAGDATALGNAVGMSVKRLQKSEAKSKVVILLTDGKQTAGDLSPKKAAEIAKALGIKVYTVGAGTRDEAPFPQRTPMGMRYVMRKMPIDEGALEVIAQTTGGRYFRAEDTKGLKAIYDEIDRLERTQITASSYMEYDERFVLFAWPALLLLLLERFLLGTVFRRLP